VFAADVERTQIIKAFRAWLAGATAQYQLERGDALRGNIDEWDGYMRIDVGKYFGDRDLVRDLKRQSIEGLVNLFDGWRESSTSFEDDVKDEYAVAGKAYLEFYLGYMARIAGGDYAAIYDAPIISMVVQTMLKVIPPDVPAEKHLRKCGEFLVSDHFKETPLQWISAHMFATLKKFVRQGAYTNREVALKRLSGFFFDVKHIATYAPYVDAFVMDQPMAELAARSTVNLEPRFGVKAFSLNNWNELFAWLEGIEATGMTEAHRAGLAAAYPGMRL